MATASDIITYARTLAETSSIGTDATAELNFVNDALNDFYRSLIEREVDAAQVQESYMTTVSAQGTYLWPSDMFQLKTIEVNFTDTQAANYIQARQLDVSNLQGDTSFDFVRQNQSFREPMFDDRGDWFEIFPTPTASMNNTNSIKIVYFLIPTEFALTSSTVAYPATLDYRIISCKAAALYLKSIERDNAAANCDAEYQKRLNQIIRILQVGSEQPISPEGLHLTGWQF